MRRLATAAINDWLCVACTWNGFFKSDLRFMVPFINIPPFSSSKTNEKRSLSFESTDLFETKPNQTKKKNESR